MKKLTIATAALLMMACSNHDMYDSGLIEEQAKSTYADNFVKTYPNVNLNQNWDYNNKNEIFSLPASGSLTRAEVSYGYKSGEDYEVDNATLNWMKNLLKENQDNRSLGNPFYMTVPGNSFTIVPIYQGLAASIFNLHVVVDGVDIKLWDKGQNIWVKKNASDTEWTPVSDLSENEGSKNTMNAAAVKATPYTFENLPVGKDMYFYLEITQAGGYNSVGAHQSSLNGMMLALEDCPLPSNLPEDNEVMIIGCENADKVGSDWDMNDVVFMVYGTQVPKPIKIEEGKPVTKKITVRYMIEDLGATDDFDFNDIVLDVSDIWTSTPRYVNGVLDSWIDSDHRQEAIIRHLGGTLPFILKIGDTELEEHAGVLGADPNEVFTVTGWNRDAHNINVKVRQEQSSTVYNNVKFPKAGEAPMIIAVEPTVGWMSERKSVPEEWFYQ